MIRHATKEDKSQICRLIKEFFKEELIARGFEYNQDKISKDFDMFAEMQNRLSLCVETDGIIDAFICAVIVDRPFFKGNTAHELMWYARKSKRKCGILLLREFEKLCKTLGIDSITMIALSESKAENIYVKLGYAKQETCYMKELKGE